MISTGLSGEYTIDTCAGVCRGGLFKDIVIMHLHEYRSVLSVAKSGGCISAASSIRCESCNSELPVKLVGTVFNIRDHLSVS